MGEWEIVHAIAKARVEDVDLEARAKEVKPRDGVCRGTPEGACSPQLLLSGIANLMRLAESGVTSKYLD